MTTDGHNNADVPQIPDALADAWAAVFIDVYEKVKERGKLPEGDATQPAVGDASCPST